VVVPRVVEAEIAVLKGIMGQAIVTIEARKGVYKEQRRVLTRLADALWSTDTLWSAGADVLEPAFAADFVDATTDDERARVIVDQIASLTDQTAIDWHNRLVGEIDPAEVGIWSPRHVRLGARAHAERRAVAEGVG
jgi:dGTPase